MIFFSSSKVFCFSLIVYSNSSSFLHLPSSSSFRLLNLQSLMELLSLYNLFVFLAVQNITFGIFDFFSIFSRFCRLPLDMSYQKEVLPSYPNFQASDVVFSLYSLLSLYLPSLNTLYHLCFQSPFFFVTL